MLEARILAIADTVEAMCSPRPYRPAAGMDAAIEEINRGAGKLYDQHLVAACTRLIRAARLHAARIKEFPEIYRLFASCRATARAI